MASRRYRTIRQRVFDLLKARNGNKPVQINDKVSKHIGTSGTALAAFLDDVNEHPGFKADGVHLVPGDVVTDPTVFELIVAIMEDYRARGWDIT